MEFKTGQLVEILGCTQATEDKWLGPINKTCARYQINTKLRMAAFIAQVGHESGRLKFVEENLNYSANGLLSVFKKYFTAETAKEYARKPQSIASRVYASRMGNGGETSGEGWKYRGRGLIQCTGKSNYIECSRSVGVDLVNNPDLLTTPDYAAMSAGWFWSARGLNAYADRKEFLTITKRINGGTNGLAERQELYERALIVLSDEDPDDGTEKPEVPPDTTSPITSESTPPASNAKISEPKASSDPDGSLYPYNSVFESRSGHIYETDDTPGKERVSMSHRTGSYWEINSDGTYTHKTVLDSYKLTKRNSYDYSGGNYVQQVDGQTYRSSTGNMVFKTPSNIFMEAQKIQFNTGILAVSGEVQAPTVNAEVFVGPFADVLAKESMLAWDIGSGGGGGSAPPVINSSIGFSDSDVVNSMRTNSLSTQAPDGSRIISNGIDPDIDYTQDPVVDEDDAIVDESLLPGAIGLAASLINNSELSKESENAIKSAAKSANRSSSGTMVFLKHASFDKPILLSQSTSNALPDPRLYQNNMHVIVNDEGVGKLYMSNGETWNLVGSDVPIDVTEQLNDLQESIDNEVVDRTQALLQEAQDRTNAISTAIQQEVLDRNVAIQTVSDNLSGSILQEAQDRQAAITAESDARQSADESIAFDISVLTTGMNDNSSAIVAEQTARTDADSALAADLSALAAEVGDNTAAIITEQTTRADADSALSTRIDELVTTSGENAAAIIAEQTARVSADEALASDITTLFTNVSDNAGLIQSEATTRATEDSALSTRIDTVSALADDNAAAIVTEQTTRADADTALSNQITTLSSTVDDNTAAITAEQTARSDGDTALASEINTISAVLDSNKSFDNWKMWNFDLTTEGWSQAGSTLAWTTGGKLIWTTLSTGAWLGTTFSEDLFFPGDKYTKVRARVRRTAGTGTWEGNLYYSTDSHVETSSYYKNVSAPSNMNDWNTIEWDMSNLTAGGSDWISNEIISLRLDLTGDSGQTWEIDWIAIGEEVSTPGTADIDKRVAAAIVTEATARADADGALATQITTLSSTVDDNTTTISTQQSSIDGIQAKYAVKVDNNGYVSGFGLISEANNGNVVSSFNILADKFSIVKPTLNDGEPVVPFSVDTTTSPATITLDGLVRIKTGNIADGAISKHLSYSNSGIVTVQETGASYPQEAITDTFNVTSSGGKVHLTYSGQCYITTALDQTVLSTMSISAYRYSSWVGISSISAGSYTTPSIITCTAPHNIVGEKSVDFSGSTSSLVSSGNPTISESFNNIYLTVTAINSTQLRITLTQSNQTITASSGGMLRQYKGLGSFAPLTARSWGGYGTGRTFMNVFLIDEPEAKNWTYEFSMSINAATGTNLDTRAQLYNRSIYYAEFFK